jgi:hypothetical protein
MKLVKFGAKIGVKQSSLYEPLDIFIIKGGEMTKSLIFKCWDVTTL